MAPHLSIVIHTLLLLFSVAALASTPGSRWTPGESRRFRPVISRSSSGATRHNPSAASRSPPANPHPQPSQLFRANLEKSFTWFDPVEHQALFGIAAPDPPQKKHGVSKRNGGPPATAPVVPNGNCIGCTNPGLAWTIDMFTVDFFIEEALWKSDRAHNSKCLFYSPAYGDDLTIWKNAGRADRELSPDGGSARLSSVATNYACNNRGMKTIWMSWPGKSEDYAGSSTDPTTLNFWEISRRGSWLYPFSAEALGDKGKTQFKYFSAMSKALATMCTGTIYLMSIQPLKLYDLYSKPHPVSGNPSILIDIELQTLKDRQQLGDCVNTSDGDKLCVLQLVAIDAVNPGTLYELNWDKTYTLKRQLSRREVELEHSWVLDMFNASDAAAQPLAARDNCGANLLYENGDWFG